MNDNDKEKAVLRFNNGDLLKGRLKNFSTNLIEVTLEEVKTNRIHTVKTDELKAIFFVRSFEGDREHREKKVYGTIRHRGQKIFIKFKDDEHLIGFLEGEVPWNRGFFLSKHDKDLKGFFIMPADLDSNNIKVFVVASSIKDVTVIP